MLQDIRDRSRGWLAYVIVGVIAVPLVLFGIYNYFTGGGGGAVAEVGGHKITSQDIANAYQRQQQQLRQMLGDAYDPSMFSEKEMRQRALDQLIDRAVLTNYARDAGYRVSDKMLGQLIRGQKVFYENGKFSRERYQRLLAQNGLSPEAYENNMRAQETIGQLQRGVMNSVMVTDADLSQVVALERQQRKVAFLRVHADAYKHDLQVSDDEIQSYYKEHQDQFKRPERVKLAYVELTMDQLASKADISEDKLRQRYQQVKDQRFTQPARRHVRHILIQVPKDASKEQVEKAKEKLESIRQRVVSGDATFAAMAKQYSDDAGSADKGGDLGFIRRGDMVKPFEQAAFSLKEGTVSQPVRTDFGWHLIKVTEVQPQKVKPFDQVKDQLRREMAKDELSNRFYDLGSKVANLAYESPDSLKPVADKFKLEIKHTGWIPRQGADQGLGSQDKVLKAAFSDEVLQKGYNSQLLELSSDRDVVVRVAEHQRAETRPLDEVRDDIVASVRQKKAADAAEAEGNKLLKQLRGDGLVMAKAADGDRVAFKDAGMIQRDNSSLPGGVVDIAFRMQRPADGKVSLTGTRLPGGDFAVVQVAKVENGKLTALSDKERKQLRDRLRSVRGQAALQSLVKSLRASADITVHKDRL